MKKHFLIIIILFSATLCALTLITKETPIFQPTELFEPQEKTKEEFNIIIINTCKFLKKVKFIFKKKI